MAFMQIMDNLGRKMLCIEISDDTPSPELPDGWTIEPANDDPLWSSAEVISDRQFAQALAKNGVITQEEALRWAARGALPVAMLDVLTQVPEENDLRFDVHITLSGATTFERHHPYVEILGSKLTNPATGLPYTSADLDALWKQASQYP